MIAARRIEQDEEDRADDDQRDDAGPGGRFGETCEKPVHVFSPLSLRWFSMIKRRRSKRHATSSPTSMTGAFDCKVWVSSSNTGDVPLHRREILARVRDDRG